MKGVIKDQATHLKMDSKMVYVLKGLHGPLDQSCTRKADKMCTQVDSY